MKINCLQENLTRGLILVSGIASQSKGNEEFSKKMRIITSDDFLDLTCTDLTKTLTCRVGAQIIEKGEILAPAKILTSLVDSFPADMVTLSSEDTKIKLKCAKINTNLNGFPVDDFPIMAEETYPTNTQIDSELLMKAISRTIFATAKNEVRLQLASVYLNFSGDTLTLVGADGFRLAEQKTSLEIPVTQDLTILLPKKSLLYLTKLLQLDKTTQIFVSPTRIRFEIGQNIVFTSLVLNLEYPIYKSLIPTDNNIKIKCDSATLRRAIKTAKILATDSANTVKFIITQGKLTIVSLSKQIGDNSEELKIDFTGKDIETNYNADYLLDVLSTLEGTVTLNLKSKTDPLLLTSDDDDKFIYVAMPIFTTE